MTDQVPASSPLDLVDRLRAVLGERERIASFAAQISGPRWEIVKNGGVHSAARMVVPAVVGPGGEWPTLAAAAHIVGYDPATVLDLLRATREIVDRHVSTWHFDEIWMCRACGNAGAPCADIRSLAAVYVPDAASTEP